MCAAAHRSFAATIGLFLNEETREEMGFTRILLVRRLREQHGLRR